MSYSSSSRIRFAGWLTIHRWTDSAPALRAARLGWMGIRCLLLLCVVCTLNVSCEAYDPSLIVARQPLIEPHQDGGMTTMTPLPPEKCASAPDLSICARPNADSVCLDG